MQRVFLIGGSSHVGKTTLAKSLASSLGWRCISTDSLARHPGRPWKTAPEVVPAHVSEHYRSLAVDELLADVLLHYRRNVWPQVEGLIETQLADGATDGLIIEGSALWPEWVTTLNSGCVGSLWLTVNSHQFAIRIYAESDYAQCAPSEQALIDAFLARTLAYDARMRMALHRLGLEALYVDPESTAESLSELCLQRIATGSAPNSP
ncbi:MAG: 2-phosphoglycerate kinase [Caldilineaceae bacterium]|nr:2-phosphoglycerate kinase [Caldilineaceae bacterium]